MDATAYLRVCSRAQDFATQKTAIERAATARGDTVTDWRAEKRSGKTLARPELDRLGGEGGVPESRARAHRASPRKNGWHPGASR